MEETTTTAAPLEVPAWVERMRAAGYTVHVGDHTVDLSQEPEFSFTAFPEPRGLRKLWINLRMLLSGEYRLALVRRDASVR